MAPIYTPEQVEQYLQRTNYGNIDFPDSRLAQLQLHLQRTARRRGRTAASPSVLDSMGQFSAALLAASQHFGASQDGLRQAGGQRSRWVLHGDDESALRRAAVVGVAGLPLCWQSE